MEEKMIVLTTAEQGLRAFLIPLAGKDQTMGYRDMSEAVDPDGTIGWNDGGRSKRLTHALFHISSYEHEHGRPLLSAMAVAKITGEASEGFAIMGRGLGFEVPPTAVGERRFWLDQRQKSVAHWTTHEDDPMADAQFSAIMTELSEVKRMLRTLVHG
jgi:hypothetical protein